MMEMWFDEDTRAATLAELPPTQAAFTRAEWEALDRERHNERFPPGAIDPDDPSLWS